jgi:hypothetical protein
MAPKKKTALPSEWPPDDRMIWGVILSLGLAATFCFAIPVVFYALPLVLSAFATGLIIRAFVTRSTLIEENGIELEHQSSTGKEMALRGFAILFVFLGFVAGFMGLGQVDKARDIFNSAAKTQQESYSISDQEMCDFGYYDYC